MGQSFDRLVYCSFFAGKQITMAQKRVILSDSSLNRYGFRVLTSGLDLEAFKKNPVMLWMHQRDDGFWETSLPIGYWDDIQVNGDELSAIPVFDGVDELSKTLKAKYEAGTLRAASLGFKGITYSSEPDDLLPGQAYATVTKAEVLEASLVDIPANGNCARLYNENSVRLSINEQQTAIPKLLNSIQTPMKLNAAWTSILSFLGYKPETELKSEDYAKLNDELSRLNAEVQTLTTDKGTAEGKVTELTGQLSGKDTEITTLKGSVTEKDQKITELNNQVANLKNGAAADDATLTPKGEITTEETPDEELAFLAKNGHDTLAVIEYYKTRKNK
jgi:hypothetical protein